MQLEHLQSSDSGIIFGRVTKVSQNGLDIVFAEGAGQVPIDEVFVSKSTPIVLRDIAFVYPIMIVVGQSIPVVKLAYDKELYSRKSAVLKALDSTSLGDIVETTIMEISTTHILGVTDLGYEVQLSRQETETALQEQFCERRLSPSGEREDRWLHLQDRVKVQVGKKLSESMRVGQLVVRGTPVHPGWYKMPSVPPPPPTAPAGLFDEVLMVDDELDAAASLEPYFRDAGYRTEWAEDAQDLDRWKETYKEDIKRDPSSRGTVVAIVRVASSKLEWLKMCKSLFTEFSSISLAFQYRSDNQLPRQTADQILSLMSHPQVLGLWEWNWGREALGALLARQSIIGSGVLHKREERISVRETPDTRIRRDDSALRYQSPSDDCRTALESWVEAAQGTASPCAAILFRIHKKGQSVSIIAAFGDKTIIEGFEYYRGSLQKSPVRDLAIFDQPSDTDNAATRLGRYLYFLDAMGGPQETLSVRGIRPAAPPNSPYSYAAFLFSRKLHGFRGNHRLSPAILKACRRAIEVALLGCAIHERNQRLIEAAEKASDYRYMAHEVAGFLKRPAEILAGAANLGRLEADDLGDVARGTLRAKQVMEQLLTKHGGQDELFSPQEIIPPYLKDITFLEIDPSAKGLAININFKHEMPNDLRLRGRRLAFECVLRNVVLNAVQQTKLYCGGMGNVDLDASLQSTESGGKKLIVTVADTGPGIHSLYWEAIFQGGVSTRPAGTGLGLALSRRLITEAGGLLELVESFVYSGTTFRITIPVDIVK